MCIPAGTFASRSWSRASRRIRGRPREAPLDHPPLRQEHEAALGVREPDDHEFDAAGRGVGRRGRAGVALVDERHLHPPAAGPLRPRRQLQHRLAVARVGGRDGERQQVAERVHRQVELGAVLALVAVVAGPRAALGRAPQGPAVEARRRRAGVAAREDAQQLPQVAGHRGEAAGGHPPPRLLVGRLPRRQVVRQHPPLAAASDDVTQGVEQLARVMAALRGVGPHQARVRGGERPLVVADVTRVTPPWHQPRLPQTAEVRNSL